MNNKTENSPPRFPLKLITGLVLFGTLGTVIFLFRKQLQIEQLAKYEVQLQSWQEAQPLLMALAAFGVYALATGVSIPGAAILTLMIGWFFGLVEGTLIVSFASTTGATLSFLASRYFFHDAIQARFDSRLKTFNAALEREGAFYLFSLRLIPAIPFFVINLVMGLTKMKVRTYWWVSQVGMFPATLVYVYAGSQIPDLATLSEQGIAAVFKPARLTQIIVAFILLGIFPLAAKKTMNWLKRYREKADQ